MTAQERSAFAQRIIEMALEEKAELIDRIIQVDQVMRDVGATEEEITEWLLSRGHTQVREQPAVAPEPEPEREPQREPEPEPEPERVPAPRVPRTQETGAYEAGKWDDKIIDLLAERGPTPRTVVIDLLGIPKSSAHRLNQRLSNEGRIVLREGDIAPGGKRLIVWALPEQAEQPVPDAAPTRRGGGYLTMEAVRAATEEMGIFDMVRLAEHMDATRGALHHYMQDLMETEEIEKHGKAGPTVFFTHRSYRGPLEWKLAKVPFAERGQEAKAEAPAEAEEWDDTAVQDADAPAVDEATWPSRKQLIELMQGREPELKPLSTNQWLGQLMEAHPGITTLGDTMKNAIRDGLVRRIPGDNDQRGFPIVKLTEKGWDWRPSYGDGPYTGASGALSRPQGPAAPRPEERGPIQVAPETVEERVAEMPEHLRMMPAATTRKHLTQRIEDAEWQHQILSAAAERGTFIAPEIAEDIGDVTDKSLKSRISTTLRERLSDAGLVEATGEQRLSKQAQHLRATNPRGGGRPSIEYRITELGRNALAGREADVGGEARMPQPIEGPSEELSPPGPPPPRLGVELGEDYQPPQQEESVPNGEVSVEDPFPGSAGRERAGVLGQAEPTVQQVRDVVVELDGMKFSPAQLCMFANEQAGEDETVNWDLAMTKIRLDELAAQGIIKDISPTPDLALYQYERPRDPGKAAELDRQRYGANGPGGAAAPVAGTGRGLKISNKLVAKLVADAEKAGCSAKMVGSGHIRIMIPSGGTVNISATPSRDSTVENDRVRLRRRGVRV